MEIYNGCLIQDFKSFEALRENRRMDKNTLRRITNRLSSCGLIKSLRDTRIPDGRKRVYVVVDLGVAEAIRNLTNVLM